MRKSRLLAVVAAGAVVAAAPSLASAEAKFVSSKRLQEAGGYELKVGLSKPVTIRSATSSLAKSGQYCNVHLQSVRQAIRNSIKSGGLTLPKAGEKPKETYLFFKAQIIDDGVFECRGEGDTCTVVVTVPPDTKVID